jgi:hypothetical protein
MVPVDNDGEPVRRFMGKAPGTVFAWIMESAYMKKHKQPKSEVREDKPNRADFHHGSTTQGGSNFGQGSMELGDKANRQGSESNDGANYENEKGWNNEALRRSDIDGKKNKQTK